MWYRLCTRLSLGVCVFILIFDVFAYIDKLAFICTINQFSIVSTFATRISTTHVCQADTDSQYMCVCVCGARAQCCTWLINYLFWQKLFDWISISISSVLRLCAAPCDQNLATALVHSYNWWNCVRDPKADRRATKHFVWHCISLNGVCVHGWAIPYESVSTIIDIGTTLSQTVSRICAYEKFRFSPVRNIR